MTKKKVDKSGWRPSFREEEDVQDHLEPDEIARLLKPLASVRGIEGFSLKMHGDVAEKLEELRDDYSVELRNSDAPTAAQKRQALSSVIDAATSYAVTIRSLDVDSKTRLAEALNESGEVIRQKPDRRSATKLLDSTALIPEGRSEDVLAWLAGDRWLRGCASDADRVATTAEAVRNAVKKDTPRKLSPILVRLCVSLIELAGGVIGVETIRRYKNDKKELDIAIRSFVFESVKIIHPGSTISDSTLDAAIKKARAKFEVESSVAQRDDSIKSDQGEQPSGLVAGPLLLENVPDHQEGHLVFVIWPGKPFHARPMEIVEIAKRPWKAAGTVPQIRSVLKVADGDKHYWFSPEACWPNHLFKQNFFG